MITEIMSSKDQTEEMDAKATAGKAEEATSNENKNTPEEENTGTEENNASEGPDMTDALTELQKKYDTLNDKYLRLYSEFENYRRRMTKEKSDALRNGGADIARELLPVVDDFERAMSSNENIDDSDTLKEAFSLIHHKLLRILETQGLKPMDSLEKPFDTEYHEAITNIPAPTEELKGKVVDVAEKGYFFNDRILRYAKVIVGQ